MIVPRFITLDAYATNTTAKDAPMIDTRSMSLLVAAVMTAVLVASPAYARGGRGGGGGGSRGGGAGFGGGGMRGPAGGGGFTRSPSISAPRPTPRPSPSPGGGRPGAGPGVGASRPAGPGSPGPGVGSRPGGGQVGLGNRPGVGDRPGGGLGPGGGNRPSIGDRPNIGDRPGGGLGPGAPNRPGIGDRPDIANRPGVGDRPGIANRPGIDSRPGGNNNVINRGDINVGNRQNNFAGNRVDPGYGVRPPAYDHWRGSYGDYHSGWVNGYWHGTNNAQGWNWGSYAVGRAVGVTAWAFGSALFNWGYASYGNPYYGGAAAEPIVIQQMIDGGTTEVVTVPASNFDYTQPLDTQSAPPAANVADPALAKFDSAREAFKKGDYATSLRFTDEALKTLPNDATLHEFRALILFAVGRYDQAASPLYAVLSVGPGWDWTTLVGLYPSVNVYTQQVRALEQFIKKNPMSSAGHFVLAYHYMTQGHTDPALSQFKKVQKLAPADALSAQLIKQLSPPGESAEPASSATSVPTGKEGKISGKWQAVPAKQTTIDLSLRDDGNFTWNASVNGKPQEIAGNWSLAGGILTLAQSGQGSALVGKVAWKDENQWNFRALGAPGDDPGLTFTH